MHSLTATALLLLSVSVFAETLLWGQTRGLGEKSIASVCWPPIYVQQIFLQMKANEHLRV